jgi:hypothetical protein
MMAFKANAVGRAVTVKNYKACDIFKIETLDDGRIVSTS